jgi:hypothetical protein
MRIPDNGFWKVIEQLKDTRRNSPAALLQAHPGSRSSLKATTEAGETRSFESWFRQSIAKGNEGKVILN